MNKKLKLRALKQLAKTEGDNIQAALNKEVEKIAVLLRQQTQYDLIEEQLEFLDAISYRVPTETVEIIKEFLEYIGKIELTYQSMAEVFEASFKKFYNKDSLVLKALAVLARVYCYQIDQILDIFLEYSLDTNDTVRKQIEKYLKICASYHISVVEKTGYALQQRIVKKIESLSGNDRFRYLQAVIILLGNIFSLEMEDESWTWNALTIRHGAIPVTNDLQRIRDKAIGFLQELYTTDSISEMDKVQILNALEQATKTPSNVHYEDDLFAMVIKNSRNIVNFFGKLISQEQYEILRIIENRISFLYHRAINVVDCNEQTKKENENLIVSIEEVHKQLKQNEEFVIYETFFASERGISKLPLPNEDEISIEQEEQRRWDRIRQYLDAIKETSFTIWEARILRYVQIRPKNLFVGFDFASQYFGKFLNTLAQEQPSFVFELITKYEDKIEPFLWITLAGLLKSNARDRVISLFKQWIQEGKYLSNCAELFVRNVTCNLDLGLDLTLLREIADKARILRDTKTLNEIIMATVLNYNQSPDLLINNCFLPTIAELTKLKNPDWVNYLWFEKEFTEFARKLNIESIRVILENLLFLNSIDFHAEAILIPIAQIFPKEVLEFFGKRLKFSNTVNINGLGNYDAIPYEFSELKKPLALISERAVDIISGWYDGNYELFVYKGAKLLHIIFPNFPSDFENKLLELVQSGENRNLEVVIAILRAYKGEVFLHKICRKVIQTLPVGSKWLASMQIVLQNTSAVWGDFGLVEAWEQKKRELEKWLQDPDIKIRNFAQEYISNLNEMIIAERRRVEEDIELRKYKDGE